MMDGLRYLSNDWDQIEKMTLKEYFMRMRVYYLKELDQRKRALQEAFDARYTKATVGSGKNMKYRFKTPQEVIDFDTAEKRLTDTGDGKRRTLARLHVIAENLKYLREEV